MKIKNCKIKNFKSAFTLVEMLVVIAILGIVMAMLILTFHNTSSRDLEITSQQVKTALEEAMSYSLAPRVSDGSVGGYGVCFKDASGWSYSIFKDTNSNHDCDSGLNEIIKTIDFKKNIGVSEIKDSANPATSPSQFYVFFGIPMVSAPGDDTADSPSLPYDRTFSFNGKNYASSPAVEYGDITFGTTPTSIFRKVRIDVITGSITIPN